MPTLRLSIGTKFIALAVAMLLACLGCIGLAADYVLRDRLTESGARDLGVKADALIALLAQTGEPAIRDGKLVFGETVVDGNDGLVDRLSTLFGGAAVGIFNGDVRVATSIKKPDGSRQVGLHMVPGVGRDAVYGRGEPYTGLTDVAGVTFFSAIRPVRDASGRIIGSVAMGNPLARTMEAADAVFVRCVEVSLPLIALAAGLMWWFTLRLVQPLVRLTGRMTAIAAGDLDAPVAMTERTDEIGAIARAVAVFRDGLSERKQLVQEQERLAKAAEAERREALHRMADGFDREVGGLVGQISGATAALETSARTMSDTAAGTHQQAGRRQSGCRGGR
jgi:methyl-accepting chemotaxis protein